MNFAGWVVTPSIKQEDLSARAQFLTHCWGVCPINSVVRPTDLVLCHTKFGEI